MALGTYDANGIWHYGESDNIALFSDTLNKLADSASSAITADRARLATLEAGSLAGLIPVKPSAATFVTGTGAVNTLGVITFTGCTSISLANVFTSKYANYRIVFEDVKQTADANDFLLFQLTASGVASTVSYDMGLTEFSISSGAAAAAGGYNAGYGAIGRRYYANQWANAVIDIFSPAVAHYTTWSGVGHSNAAAIPESSLISGMHRVNTAYDGIRIYMSANAMTGKATIYGYNN